MALHSLCGVPGSGKTLNATRMALDYYKKQNNIFRYYIHKLLYKIPKLKDLSRYEYYCQFPFKKINNIYSNYPILLDRKKKIYSNRVSLWDLNSDYSFYPDAFIIIDEVQLYVDSDETNNNSKDNKELRKQLKRVAKFMQAHRHFGINEIYLISQHPSRIFKKARNICEDYFKQKKLIQLPFKLNRIFPIAIMKGMGYYDFEFYGRFVPKDRKEKKKLPFDYYKKFKIFNAKKVFKAYDSRYLSNYNYGKPLVNYGTYNTKKVEYEYLKGLFEE